MNVIPETMDTRHIRQIQMALNELAGSRLDVDGNFGQYSINSLKMYQVLKQLPVTGIYDSPTQALMEPFIKNKYLTEEDFALAANVLLTDIFAIKAVIEVESAGDGFLADGRPVILFERHKFYSFLAMDESDQQMKEYVRIMPNIINPQRGGYFGKEKEWLRLEAAMAINHEAALKSTSWGMFQIMGFNHRVAGFKDVDAMIVAMKESERKQLDAFIAFIKSNQHLSVALQDKDWTTFARHYNGPLYMQNQYDVKLVNAYDKYKSLRKQA